MLQGLSEPDDRAPLSLALLGDFQISAGHADIRPRSRKAAAILAFVASQERRSSPRARLADLLWSDRGEEQARASLRQAIAEIRTRDAALARALAISRDSVGFPEGTIVTDIEGILLAAARSDAGTLAERLEQVEGVFLDDLDGLSPAFDDWLRAERVRQQERLFAIVLDATTRMSAPEDMRARQRILAALERLDPVNEAVARMRLRVDHASGDAASLHRRYRRLVDELASELGVRPSAETSALFERLVATVPAPRDEGSLAATPSATQPPLILVTPLAADAGRDSADIAAACTEDIRVALAKHRELRVLMLEAVEPRLLEQMGASAVAAYMLSGSVRRPGADARINLQLGNVVSGVVSWSEQLRLGDAPVAEIIEQVVARAVGAVMPVIDRELPIVVPQRRSERGAGDAVLCYARGRKLARDARSLDAAWAGAALLQEAIAHDPAHIGARLLLAQLYNSDFWHMMAGHDVADFRARAMTLAEEAAAIDPGNVRTRLRLAWCYLRRRDWRLAERGFRECAEALPYDADALDECAFGLCQLGEIDAARDLMRRAFQLNPFAPADYHADQAVMLAFAGDAAAAEEHFEVSPEKALIYQAVRLGNLAAMAEPKPREAALRRQFIDGFAAIWQPGRRFERDDIVDWLDHAMCLKRPEHRAIAVAGVDAAWLRSAD